jgi:hypothetical protein
VKNETSGDFEIENNNSTQRMLRWKPWKKIKPFIKPLILPAILRVAKPVV